MGEANELREDAGSLAQAGDALWSGISPSEMRYMFNHAGPAASPLQICREAFGSDSAGYASFCLGQEFDDGAPRATAAQGYDFSETERLACVDIGWQLCYEYYRDAQESYRLTEALFSGARVQSDSTMANAFQHAFWLALMVNSDEGSPGAAWTFGVAHEQYWYNAPTQDIDGQKSRMDIINNHVGHKRALQLIAQGGNALTDERACRDLFDRVVHSARYIAPPKDPRQRYFELDLAPEYYVPVYRKLKAGSVTVAPYNENACEDANN